jgi:hypothetical protein
MTAFIQRPQYVGGYRMGHFRFNLERRPVWVHRVFMRLFLGWLWVDGPD